MRDDWPPLGVSATKPEPARYYTSTEACSCPDFVYRRMRAKQYCKHQKALNAALELIDANVAKWDGRTGPRGEYENSPD